MSDESAHDDACAEDLAYWRDRLAGMDIADARMVLVPHFIAATGQVRRACKLAKLPRCMHYQWCELHPEYAAATEHAMAVAVDTLADEAVRRGRDGVDEPVYQQGQLVGYKRVYDGKLLMFMLGALAPDKYRQGRDRSDEAQAQGSTMIVLPPPPPDMDVPEARQTQGPPSSEDTTNGTDQDHQGDRDHRGDDHGDR